MGAMRAADVEIGAQVRVAIGHYARRPAVIQSVQTRGRTTYVGVRFTDVTPGAHNIPPSRSQNLYGATVPVARVTPES